MSGWPAIRTKPTNSRLGSPDSAFTMSLPLACLRTVHSGQPPQPNSWSNQRLRAARPDRNRANSARGGGASRPWPIPPLRTRGSASLHPCPPGPAKRVPGDSRAIRRGVTPFGVGSLRSPTRSPSSFASRTSPLPGTDSGSRAGLDVVRGRGAGSGPFSSEPISCLHGQRSERGRRRKPDRR